MFMYKFFTTQAINAILLTTLIGACSLSDPVARLSSRYHIPESRIVTLANLLGVVPSEIENYSVQAPFPVNYYIQTLETADLLHRKHKSELSTVVRGYEATCERDSTDPTSSVLFFFYSREVVRPANEIPVVMEIQFTQPIGGEINADPPVGNVGYIDITKSEFAHPGSTWLKECIEK